MPRREKQQPISKKFVVAALVVVSWFIYYLTDTNDLKKINSKKTFDEMLEYTNNRKPVRDFNNSIPISDTNAVNIDLDAIKTVPQNYNQPVIPQNEQTLQEMQPTITQQDKYNALLDKLRMYPEKSVGSVENIINQILAYKGYYEGTINLVVDDTKKNNSVKGSYIVAYFDFQKGNMHINKDLLYSVPREQIIAIIAHELDHFDKIACLCKAMGSSNFEAKLRANNLNDFNFIFWQKASARANIENFDAKKYEQALIRYINQNSIDLVSSYSDFYRLSEHIRNPLEISAYEVSDYILNYYKQPSNDGPTYRLVEKFNEVDWSIYNAIRYNSIIENERIAFFDYFFMKAIARSHQKYQQVLDYCINNANGDLTSFWLSFEQDNMSFYNKNAKITLSTYETMYNLLNQTNVYAKSEINDKIICDALKYKINTLLSNIVYPNALKNIRLATNAFLQHIKRNNISLPDDELNYMLLLICMENDLYRNNSSKDTSLYYLKVPEEIKNIYHIQDRKLLYKYIYSNAAFKKQLSERQNLTEQALLVELLDKTRPNVKVQL